MFNIDLKARKGVQELQTTLIRLNGMVLALADRLGKDFVPCPNQALGTCDEGLVAVKGERAVEPYAGCPVCKGVQLIVVDKT